MKKGHLFENIDFLRRSSDAVSPSAAWQPAADVYHCQGGWLIKFDLAGVRHEDIKIRLIGSTLVVSGTRRDCRVYEHQVAHSMEIAYSRFERSVELPNGVSADNIRSEYQDGMLLVHIMDRQGGDA
jgi:HSP20 family protein